MDPQHVLRAIAEPRRQAILEVLRDHGPLAVGVLAERVAVTQQAASQHLKVLEDAGVVEARREGTRRLYAVRPEGFQPVAAFVAGFWADKLGTLARVVGEGADGGGGGGGGDGGDGSAR